MFENSLIVVNIKLDNARWFLRGLNKPFDPFAQKAMHDTMIGIANCTEAVWAYLFLANMKSAASPEQLFQQIILHFVLFAFLLGIVCLTDTLFLSSGNCWFLF